jgi:hypothetical protein
LRIWRQRERDELHSSMSNLMVFVCCRLLPFFLDVLFLSLGHGLRIIGSKKIISFENGLAELNFQKV